MFVGEIPNHITPGADISELVLMPGDPLRAKYVAENFLKDAKLVNDVRNMLGYTGYYKGHKVTVMGSGMGMPSMGIYCFELFHFFNVQKIIRIGTGGGMAKGINVGDLVLPDKIYSESYFAYTYNDYNRDLVEANEELNKDILQATKEANLMDKLHVGMIATTDAFGPYIDYQRLYDRIPKEYHILAEDMETFALCHIANIMNRKATAIMTISNSKYSENIMSIEDRQKSLNDMIKIALEAIIK